MIVPTSLHLELLDPEDESLAFVLKRENVRPISMCRAQNGHGEFLLCYDGRPSVLDVIATALVSSLLFTFLSALLF